MFSSDIRRDGWVLSLAMLAVHNNLAPVATNWSAAFMFLPAVLAHAVAVILWLCTNSSHKAAKVAAVVLVVLAMCADVWAIILLASGALVERT